MGLNQTLGYGETETAATSSSGTGLVHPVEALKDNERAARDFPDLSTWKTAQFARMLA